MASAGVTTTGLSEFRHAVDVFPAAVQRALQEVAAQTATRIAQRARQLVPVQSGYTRDQIVVVDDRAHHAYHVEVGPTTSHPGTREHPLMLPAWIEFGTRYIPARPFMRPAIDAERDRYRHDLETAAARAAQQAFR